MRKGLVLALVGLAVVGCKGKAPPPAPVSSASAAVTPPPSASAVVAAAAPPPPKAAINPPLEEVRIRARNRVEAVVAKAKGGTVDCTAAVPELDASLGAALYRPGEDDAAAMVALARCADEKKRWFLLAHLAALVEATGGDAMATLFRAHALVGMGQYDDALKMLVPLAKGRDPEASLAVGIAAARLGDYDGAVRRADQALFLLGKKTDDLASQAHLLKADALLRRGKLDDAAREIDTLEKAGANADGVKKLLAMAREKRLIADVEAPGEVFLGLFPIMGKGVVAGIGPLVSVRLYNVANRTMPLKVEAALPGITQTATKPVKLVAAYEATRLTPALYPLFDAASVTAPQAGAITVKVEEEKEGGLVYLEESRPTRLYPRSYLPLAVHLRGDEIRATHELLAAWVTPHAPALAPIVEAAKARVDAPESNETPRRVRALWEELAASGYSFARASEIVPDDGPPLAVRFPDETAATKHGDAKEGSVFFASLLKAMGLDPVLIVVPGHTFVGWLPSKADRQAGFPAKLVVGSLVGDVYFVEITSLGQRPFDTAVLRGNAEYVENAQDGVFAQGRGSLVVVSRGPKIPGLTDPAATP